MLKRTRNILLSALMLLVGMSGISMLAWQVRRGVSSDPYQISATVQIDGAVLREPRVLPNFTLVSDRGVAFTKDSLKKHWTLLFFGFTNCGYVCPTTLSALNQLYSRVVSQLPEKEWPQIVLLSVDPERDTVEKLHTYVRTFNPAFLGVRGDLTEIKKVTDAMGAVFMKMTLPDGSYTMNHSAEIMLLDPNGNLRAFFAYPHQGPQMAQDYISMMRSLPHGR